MTPSRIDRTPRLLPGRRRIVIVGGGFGGLACARALAGADVQVTLVDRTNHHLFQPLLYQVSTAALSPADIAAPIRHVLARARNVGVVLGEVTGVDLTARQVELADGGWLPFDQLVLATGSVYDYFGHRDWAPHAPAPKTLADARTIRSHLLAAFEEAEGCPDAERRRALLTIAVIGGGATGVEMAGTIAELARQTLRGDFRRIDPATARIVLIEAGSGLLSAFPTALGRYAASALAGLGVEIRLDAKVTDIDADGVRIGDEHLPAHTVIWGAGTRAAPGCTWIGKEGDRHGRIGVDATLAVSGLEGIYALGDLSTLQQDGKDLPALAQVAQQQGTHLGKALRTAGVPAPFTYRSKGDTAVIGRHAAVYAWGKLQLTGRSAWVLWSLVHVFLLIGFERRLLVMTQWAWHFMTHERGARLIDR